MTETGNRGPLQIAYLVKKLSDISYSQIGRTVIQKMTYLLSREGLTNYSFALYHYGPYSGRVSSDLDLISMSGIVDVKWQGDKGYFISPNQKGIQIAKELSSAEKEQIDKIVETYHEFNAVELSLIATAYYVIDKYNVTNDEELVTVVTSLKPQYAGRVNRVLRDAKIIPLPNN
ncbi:type II toxin-antitoxin system antitoxin SocA domain-containing protein [Methanoculleus sp. MH98A]|uniref:type II toxin-antitoxin system antitoxin SocA domain-containing protein n=1 Tax=Methanoculleus sp. MH98A TaxID=1495314 RepID=UPI0012DDEA2D|nr:type II toxin-antitoxin system antitoxin SocA domain-containing protein [Methanoculleus sp. MH98A]